MKRNRKMRSRWFTKICVSYYKRCPYCLYAGGGWGDSGECPVCGEIS